MAMTETTTTAEKPNIGVFINPEHSEPVPSLLSLCVDVIIPELWIQETTPTTEQAISGSSLREGEVIIKVRSTGICGSDIHFCESPSRRDRVQLPDPLDKGNMELLDR